ncbi:N-terminal acetyltransferase, partial [Globomyces sp. JEL0801]
YDLLNEQRTPSVDLLTKIHLNIITMTPYENLSVWYGPIPSLKPTNLLDKINLHRGGVCLELNTLYAMILKYFGFEVEFRSAKVIRSVTNEMDVNANRRDTHMVLVVKWLNSNDSYMCDVGFSADAPLTPMLMENETIHYGAGGIECQMQQGTWLNQNGWFLLANDLRQQQGFKKYWFMDSNQYSQTYFDDMMDYVSRPDITPPNPHHAEYATMADRFGNRFTLLGSPTTRYTFYGRDRFGVAIGESLKFNDLKTRNQILKSKFGIVMNDLVE